MPSNKKILISLPYLPQPKIIENYYKKIFNSKIVTNNGPYKKLFSDQLSRFHKTQNLHLVSSCTIGLDIALSILPPGSEIITTPYSYIATLNSILWRNLKPVFVDIKKNSFNIDEDKLEKKITKNTSAILATHVYGLPCNHHKIKLLSKKYNLKIIYDAAHAFGVKENNKLISNYGDINVISLHATKVIHSIEGGIVITKNLRMSNKLKIRSQFGHVGDEYKDIGINAKLSELHSIIGYEVLQQFEQIKKIRKKNYDFFNLKINNKLLIKPLIPKNIDYNYSYYPLRTQTKKIRDSLIKNLNKEHIYPRKYFSPSLNLLKFNSNDSSSCPNSEKMANTTICLPIHYGLSEKTLTQITRICNKTI